MAQQKRVGFRRAELARITMLLHERTETSALGLRYKDGQSDTTSAEAISTALERPITPDDAKRVRIQLLGKMVGDGKQSTSEALSVVLRAQEALAARLMRMEERLAQIENELTEPSEDAYDPPPVRVEPKSLNGRR